MLPLLRHGLRPWPVGSVGWIWSIIRSQGFGTYPECVCGFHLQPVSGEGNPLMSLSPPPFRSLSTSMGKCPEARVNNSKGSTGTGCRVESEAPRCPPLQGPPRSHAPPEQAPWPHWLLPALLPQLLPTRAPCSQPQPPCSTPQLLSPPPPPAPVHAGSGALTLCPRSAVDSACVRPTRLTAAPGMAVLSLSELRPEPESLPPLLLHLHPVPLAGSLVGSEPSRPEHSRPAHLPFPRLRARQAAAQKQGLAGFPEAQWEPWSVLGEWQLYEPFLKTA